MNTPPAQVRQITDQDAEEFDQLLRIYRASIPAEERKGDAAIAALLNRSDYRTLVIGSGHRLNGFAILFESATMPLALLEYMAVDSVQRNLGLGGRLFRAAVDAIGRRTLLLEVDSDREQAPDLDLRRRRKLFYRRLGCRQVEGFDYIMPLVSDARPPVMDLLIANHPGDHVRTAELRAWIEEIYGRVYDQARDDPRIASMLEGMTETVSLIG